MKKVAIGVLVVVVAAILFFVLRGGGGDRPAVAEAVPAAHTAGLAGVQSLDAVARRWMPVAQMIDPSLTPEAVETRAGFDPTTAEGWRGVGIDPAAGVGFAIDARVVSGAEPLPLLLVKLTDTDKALAWISARVGQPVTIEGDGPVRQLKVGGESVAIGERAGWTVILGAEPHRVEAAEPGFAAFLADDSPSLADADIYADAFTGAQQTRVFWWGGAKAAGSMFAAFGAPEEVTSTADFYASMFPAAASWLGEAGSGTRVVATERGLGLIRKLFVPQRRNPKVARYVGAKGWAAVRFSANLSTVLDGVGEAIPPAAAQAKAAVGIARMTLPLAVGVNWDDIAAALSGHMVLAGEVASLGRMTGGGLPDAILLLGVNDGAKADALVSKLIERAKSKVPGVTVSDIEIEGEKGRSIAMGPMKNVVLRVDDVLLVGPEAAVQAALKRADGEHLDGRLADALDGDAMWAAVADLKPALVEVEKRIAQDANARNPLKDPALVAFAEDPRVSLIVDLDGKGLLWRTDTAVPIDVLAATVGAWLWTTNSRSTSPTGSVPAEAVEAVPPPR